MRYLSVCSGIEAATVAWHPLGWEPAAFSDIEAFPRAALRHHYPHVPLHGRERARGESLADYAAHAGFQTIEGDEYGTIDLLVGGTPCQSFSIAGLRGGLADERGNLALEYLRLARRTRARWLVWENVPGVLSSGGGRDFGAILGGMAELGYGFAYAIRDAQFFGVPQRRRRVFVVGYLGDWRRAAAVLFERHGLSGHPAPRREAGQAAPTLPSRSTAGGGLGTDFDLDGGLIANDRVFPTLDCAMDQKFGSNQWVNSGQYAFAEVAHALRAEGFDASEDGTGRGTPIVPVAIQERAISENADAGPDGKGWRDDGQAYTLEARTVPQAVAFSAKDYGADAMGDCSPTLRAGAHATSHANAGAMPAVAFAQNSRNELRLEGGDGQVAGALNRGGGKPGQGHPAVTSGLAVRRLTPRECERLQGFPDDYTAIPWRGKAAADCPDGPRYKALGNSMAVPVMRWIGERIAAVEAMALDERAAA